ncbi:heme ABC transporter substrate-binding protein IsdE [Paenibacillus sp. PAMC21692]|uniref:heme ABC transporter substrate-binding protein IsdE n=1 Tax=Paenibacillus sp. PAMC21692 TaxID=2762320 RepID=UPI00164EB49C|nr:heme ABC transporter substrate-binding protein IsdE [Paenibacillus sp. PAMC21692]QNK59261.1 heme ABC transporter substrate-binding protein IsdE [Paenibacillus sp. PAMC21692]
MPARIWTPLKLISFVCACVLLLAACGTEAQISSDAKGNKTTVDDEASNGSKPSTEADTEYRIVSTTVAITEILDALDLDAVGIPTTYKELPGRFKGVTEIGNPMSPDMELVRSLLPTHVLSVSTLEDDLKDGFEAAKVKADFLDFTNLQSMKEEIRSLGEQFNRTELAETLIANYDGKIAELKQRATGEAPTVMILMGVPGSYLVGTANSYIGDLVNQLGGINVVEQSDVEFISANTEYLYHGNADIILRAAHGMPDEVIKMFDEEFRTNDIWKHFKAVQNDRVYDLPEDLFGTTGNMAVEEALEALADMLYSN